MAWSPYKDTVIGYVSANPGCSKWDVASRCTYNSSRCPSKQYYIVNTALRNGWIVGYISGRSYRLYTPTHPDWAKHTAAIAKRQARRAARHIDRLPTLAERLAAFKSSRRLAEQRAASEAARLAREEEEYTRFMASMPTPQGRILFNGEGGFRVENN